MARYVTVSAVLLTVTLRGVAVAAVLSSWTQGPPTNAGSAFCGIAGVPGHLYMITQSGAVEVAPIAPDGSLGAWAVGPPLNFARQFGITLATNTHLYATGGWRYPGGDPGAGGEETATVEVAAISPDGSLGPWAYTAPMTIARSVHAGAVAAGRLYVFGDYGNYGGAASVESAAVLPDGTLSPWRAEVTLNRVRQRGAAAVVSNYLYAMGGLPFTTTVERALIGADGVLGPWEYVSDNLLARYHVGAAAIGPFLFALGGYNDAQGQFASVEMATVSSAALGTWSFAPDLTMPRGGCDATAVGNTLYAAGPSSYPTVEFATLTGCGNGVLEAGEDCDDANAEAGDCCSPTCELEASPPCDPDQDNDGIDDATEPCVCLDTPAGAITTQPGCGLEQVCRCTAPLGRARWNSRREYMSCIRGATLELVNAGRITTVERKAAIRGARASGCGED